MEWGQVPVGRCGGEGAHPRTVWLRGAGGASELSCASALWWWQALVGTHSVLPVGMGQDLHPSPGPSPSPLLWGCAVYRMAPWALVSIMEQPGPAATSHGSSCSAQCLGSCVGAHSFPKGHLGCHSPWPARGGDSANLPRSQEEPRSFEPMVQPSTELRDSLAFCPLAGTLWGGHRVAGGGRCHVHWVPVHVCWFTEQ